MAGDHTRSSWPDVSGGRATHVVHRDPILASMTELVAIEIGQNPDRTGDDPRAEGERFVNQLRRVWDDGDAVLPLDPRLPVAERNRVLAATGPARLVDADGQTHRLTHGAPLLDGDALVIPTSGTTGEPKGVIHTHDGIAASAHATSAAIDVDPERDRWLACLPLAHVGGLSVVTRSLHTNTPFEVHTRFDPSLVDDALDRGATLVSLVTRALSQVPIERFRMVVIGGAAPPADRPRHVVATYGMTETGSGIVYERRAIDGVELRVDADGELQVRGPMLLRAYRRLDDATGHDPKTADGWFPTGDLGEIDAEGVLQVFGRRGDVIVTGGEKVWPARVEPVITRLSSVADVIVSGRPHPDWGHEVVARIVPANRDTPPTLDEIRATVKAELPSWYAPRSLEIVDDLPRTSLGKIRRA